MWEIIPKITSVFALIAFVAAILLLAYRSRLKQQEKLVNTLEPQTRGPVVDSILDRLSVDTTNLTKQQRYDLAIRLIDARARRFTMSAVVVAVLGAIGVGLAMLPRPNGPPTTRFPPKLPFDTAWVFVGYRGPDEYSEGPYMLIAEGDHKSAPKESRVPKPGDVLVVNKERSVTIANFKKDGLKNQLVSPPLVNGVHSSDDETGVTFLPGTLVMVRDVVESAFPGHDSAIWCRVASCSPDIPQCRDALKVIKDQ